MKKCFGMICVAATLAIVGCSKQEQPAATGEAVVVEEEAVEEAAPPAETPPAETAPAEGATP